MEGVVGLGHLTATTSGADAARAHTRGPFAHGPSKPGPELVQGEKDER